MTVRAPDGKFVRHDSMWASYKFHLLEELATQGGIHPDGCFYCGGRHKSAECSSPEQHNDPSKESEDR